MQRHLRETQEAAAASRAAQERDDLRHVRQLVADQAGLMGSLVTRVMGIESMMRDLVNAALTSDVREVVQQLQHWRAHSNELEVMASSYRAELREYIRRYGVMEDWEPPNGG
jgi:hypothetical protein